MRAVLTPSTLSECFDLLERHPDALPLAGGTDLLVWLRANEGGATRAGGNDRRPLLALGGLAELNAISDYAEHGAEHGAGLVIGAATSFARLIADPRVGRHAPLLVRAARSVGGPAIRNMATIGGNVCSASPAGDSLPPLHLLDAQIELASRAQRRRLPIGEFISAPRQTLRQPGEIVTRIVLPPAGDFTHQCYEKVGRRQSMAISVVSFCAQARLAADGRIEQLRLAWGSVAPTVVRLPALEAELTGQRPDRLAIRRAASVARDGVAPISDIRASADYRRLVAGKLLTRFLEELHGAS